MTKVKAFTILEMLINLTIMSIIMGLIYFAYASFVQQVISYQKIIDQENRLTRSYVQIKTDFFYADRVVKMYQGFKVIRYNNEEIDYKITGNYLIRKQQEVSDTLKITKINIASEISFSTKEDLVSDVTIESALYEEPLAFTIVKNYAPNLKLKL